MNVADVTVSNPLLRDDSCNWAAKSQIVKLLAFQETRNVTKFQNMNKNCAKLFTNIMHIISCYICIHAPEVTADVPTSKPCLGGWEEEALKLETFFECGFFLCFFIAQYSCKKVNRMGRIERRFRWGLHLLLKPKCEEQVRRPTGPLSRRPDAS